MNILITGTTSGIGSDLYQISVKEHTTLCVNRKNISDENNHVLNIHDYDAVFSFIKYLSESKKEPDVIFLNAGITKQDFVPDFCWSSYNEVMQTNYLGVLHFLRAAQECHWKNKKFVLISSTSLIVPNASSFGYYLSKLSATKAFGFFAKNDIHNSYKVVILGPVHTMLNKEDKGQVGIRKFLFNALAVPSEQAARNIFKFALYQKKRTLYYPFRSILFYLLVRLTILCIPKLKP